jgi:HAD superfamily hydrolase (TIGR01509 family)
MVCSIILNIFKAGWNYAKIMKIINLDSIDKKSISNIVFDWGGVITNINFDATIKAFADLGFTSIENIFDNYHQQELFSKLEKGLVEPNEFYNRMRQISGTKWSDAEIQKAWCKMLLNTPISRIELLKKLRDKYKLYLLSNTNKIHSDYYNDYLEDKYNIDYEGLFNKVYYSHEMGMRKPDLEIFEFVLADETLFPAETLFVDDTEINVDMASSAGIIAMHLRPGFTIEKIFEKWAD